MAEDLIHNISLNIASDLIRAVDPDLFVGNLELEDGNDYLLENGGFILLE